MMEYLLWASLIFFLILKACSDELDKEYARLNTRYQAEKCKVQELETDIKDKQVRKAKADALIKLLADA